MILKMTEYEQFEGGGIENGLWIKKTLEKKLLLEIWNR